MSRKGAAPVLLLSTIYHEGSHGVAGRVRAGLGTAGLFLSGKGRTVLGTGHCSKVKASPALGSSQAKTLDHAQNFPGVLRWWSRAQQLDGDLTALSRVSVLRSGGLGDQGAVCWGSEGDSSSQWLQHRSVGFSPMAPPRLPHAQEGARE